MEAISHIILQHTKVLWMHKHPSGSRFIVRHVGLHFCRKNLTVLQPVKAVSVMVSAMLAPAGLYFMRTKVAYVWGNYLVHGFYKC